VLARPRVNTASLKVSRERETDKRQTEEHANDNLLKGMKEGRFTQASQARTKIRMAPKRRRLVRRPR